MSSSLKVESFHGARFELALEQLQTGGSFAFDGVSFAIRSGVLECDVPSTWKLENVTSQSAERDLARGDAVLSRILSESEAFAALAQGVPRVLILVHDYGNGSVEICRQRDGKRTWTKEPRT